MSLLTKKIHLMHSKNLIFTNMELTKKKMKSIENAISNRIYTEANSRQQHLKNLKLKFLS
jgi:hypothetical protein